LADGQVGRSLDAYRGGAIPVASRGPRAPIIASLRR